jgi:hypothetical protein
LTPFELPFVSPAKLFVGEAVLSFDPAGDSGARERKELLEATEGIFAATCTNNAEEMDKTLRNNKRAPGSELKKHQATHSLAAAAMGIWHEICERHCELAAKESIIDAWMGHPHVLGGSR